MKVNTKRNIAGLVMTVALIGGLTACHLTIDDSNHDVRLCQDVGEAAIDPGIIVTDANWGTQGGYFYANCEAVHTVSGDSHFDCYGVRYDNHEVLYRYTNGDNTCPRTD